MSTLSQSLIFSVTNGDSTRDSVEVDYPNTGTSTMSYVSYHVKGDGYYGSGDGVHTVSYSATKYFQGTIKMQATLASAPVELDWFDVADTTLTYRVSDVRTDNTTDIYNFTGNFVWVRCCISMDEGAVMVVNFNH